MLLISFFYVLFIYRVWGSRVLGNQFWIWRRPCLSFRNNIEDPST